MARAANARSAIGKVASSYVTVHQERCALVRNRNADCLRCAQACTSGCISFDGDMLVVAPEKCIGCGTCATACPTCALEAHHPNDAVLLADCRASSCGGQVCIACSAALEGKRFDGVARVECLGRVEESLLSTLVAEGVETIHLMHGDCASCSRSTGFDMVCAVLTTERTLLDVWHAPAHIQLERIASVCAYDIPENASACDSGSCTDTTASLSDSDEYVKVMADGTLPHFVPDRREALLDALAVLGKPDDRAVSTRLWGRITIDAEKCTSCRMCATFCPTGAIAKFDDANGTMGVEHYPGNCVQCRSCETICRMGAIAVHDDVNVRDMLSGGIDRFRMTPPSFKRSEAHTIWHAMQNYMNVEEVYER